MTSAARSASSMSAAILVRRKRLGNALVPAGEEPHHPLSRRERHRDAGAHGAHRRFRVAEPGQLVGRGRRSGAAGLGGRQGGAQLGHPPVDVLEQDGLLTATGGDEQGPGGRRLQKGGRGRTTAIEKPESRSVFGEQPERGVRHPARLGEPVEEDPRQLAGVDDVGDALAQLLEPPHELVALAEQGRDHPLLDLVAHGVEEGQDDEGGHERIEEEELGPAPDPRDEAPVDFATRTSPSEVTITILPSSSCRSSRRCLSKVCDRKNMKTVSAQAPRPSRG